MKNLEVYIYLESLDEVLDSAQNVVGIFGALNDHIQPQSAIVQAGTRPNDVTWKINSVKIVFNVKLLKRLNWKHYF